VPISCDQAVRLGFVLDPTGRFEGRRDASYDLQARLVIWNGREYDLTSPVDRQAQIPPQGTFTIVSREILSIGDGFVAYAFLKTSIAREGILAINTGLIDAGWHNYLATTAINVSKDPFPLVSLESFIRVVFEPVSGPKKPVPAEPYDQAKGDRYTKSQVAQSLRFPSSFLDIPGQQEAIVGKVKKEIVADMWGRTSLVVLLVAIVSLVLASVIPAILAHGGTRYEAAGGTARYETDLIMLEGRVSGLERSVQEAIAATALPGAHRADSGAPHRRAPPR
jgi:deoxycytidine triphosphate deaminase